MFWTWSGGQAERPPPTGASTDALGTLNVPLVFDSSRRENETNLSGYCSKLHNGLIPVDKFSLRLENRMPQGAGLDEGVRTLGAWVNPL